MKKTFVMMAVLACSLAAEAQSLMAGSYNIRYKNDGDSINGNLWSNRSRAICGQINWEQPDIFGTQEGYAQQLKELESRLDGYAYIGVGRDDGKESGEHSAIFYKKEHFDLLNNGDFWLSETPDRPGLGWDAVCTRICSWGEFRDKRTRFRFFFFNLHMDHVGTTARRESAKLVIEKIKKLAGKKTPVILTGDFNVDQSNEIYRIFTESGLLKDTYTNARQRFAENGTFNHFRTEGHTNSRIDHIFVSPRFTVNNYGVLTNAYWTAPERKEDEKKNSDPSLEIELKNYVRRVPSDHYPVFTRITFGK